MGIESSKPGKQFEQLSKRSEASDKVAKDIEFLGKQIEENIKRLGWEPNSREMCKDIKFFFRNKLMQFNKEYLKNYVKGTVELGLLYKLAPEEDKVKYCDIILKYFEKKIYLKKTIEQHLYTGCKDMERIIVRNFGNIITKSKEQYKTEETKKVWETTTEKEAWQRMENLQNIISKWYYRLLTNLKTIEKQITNKELERVESDTFSLLTNGWEKCCMAVDALRDFTWEERTDAFGDNFYHNVITLKDSKEIPTIETLSPIQSLTPYCAREFLEETETK